MKKARGWGIQEYKKVKGFLELRSWLGMGEGVIRTGSSRIVDPSPQWCDIHKITIVVIIIKSTASCTGPLTQMIRYACTRTFWETPWGFLGWGLIPTVRPDVSLCYLLTRSVSWGGSFIYLSIYLTLNQRQVIPPFATFCTPLLASIYYTTIKLINLFIHISCPSTHRIVPHRILPYLYTSGNIKKDPRSRYRYTQINHKTGQV